MSNAEGIVVLYRIEHKLALASMHQISTFSINFFAFKMADFLYASVRKEKIWIYLKQRFDVENIF